jgi:hypothetical protein
MGCKGLGKGVNSRRSSKSPDVWKRWSNGVSEYWFFRIVSQHLIWGLLDVADADRLRRSQIFIEICVKNRVSSGGAASMYERAVLRLWTFPTLHAADRNQMTLRSSYRNFFCPSYKDSGPTERGTPVAGNVSASAAVMVRERGLRLRLTRRTRQLLNGVA